MPPRVRQITPVEWAAMSWHARMRARRRGLAPFTEDIGSRGIPPPRPADPPPARYRVRVHYAWDDAGTWVVTDGRQQARCGSWAAAVDFARRVTAPTRGTAS